MSATSQRNGNGASTTTTRQPAVYVPDLVVPARHGLHKAASARIDPFNEIGTSGLRQFGGYVLEEWLAQLSGRKAAWVWREMLDNDPVVGAVMFAIRWMAHGIQYSVEGGNGRAAELVETSMHDMSHTWGDFVSECLSFLPYGWAFHEPVYKRRNGPQPDGPLLADDNGAYTTENNSHKASSKYTDGLIGWRKIPVRAQETLLRWGFDGYSGLSYMEQIDWHGGDHKIPIQKGLLFRTQTTRGNPEGRSILRNAFTSYFALKNIRQIEAIGIERDLAGIPVATPPEGVDLFSAGNAQLLAKVQQLVTQIRRDEYEGVVLPQAGWDLSLLSTAGSRQFDTDKVVRRYRADIALSMLADFVLIGQDSVGSFAMVEVKSDMFGVAIDGILDLVCEIFNQYAIPRLLRLNGMDVQDAPELKHGSARKIDLDRVGSFLQAISLAGAPIPWSKQLLEALFADAGLPADFEDHDAAEGLPGQKPPDAPADLEGERVAAEQQQAAEQVEKRSLLTKAQTRGGVMVALYPHKEVAHDLAIDDGERAGDLHLTLAYLGDSASFDQADDLRNAVAQWAERTPPVTGQISGAGVFTHGPEPVSYATPDLPGLGGHRERLVRHLSSHGLSPSADHGFTPHITLAYGRRELPDVAHHPLRFDHATVKIGDQRHDFQLQGRSDELAKAETRKVRQGTVVDISPHLQARHRVLAAQADKEIEGALAQLGDQAALAYQKIADKASAGALHRLVAKVMRALDLQAWIENTLRPILRNHAGRVAADTQRTIQAEIGLEVGIADQAAERIADHAGVTLGMRDIEPQVRQAILLAIRKGLEAGENPVKTAQRIRDQVPAGRFVNAGPKYRAQLISRDQTATMQRQAALAAYQSNPHVTHVELRDGIYGPPRSDPDCISRDGEIVPIDEATGVLPEHPLCTLGFSPVVTASAPLRTPEPALA